MTKTKTATAIAAANIVAEVPTADSITNHVTNAIDALFSAFHETEMRRLADNGKLYPVDATLPAGVEDTGNLEAIRTWRYVQDQLVSVIPWKIEDMLYRCDEQIADQRRQIKAAVRQLESGRVEPSFIEAKADYLERLLVQHSMLASAFEAARTAHLDLCGHEYETRAARAERRAVEAAKPKSAMADRLRQLGVN